ncbi:hypothetical protein HGI79_15690 [Clostridium sp. DJ247]|nr:hypothetical protein [Clostridium sp. DJ247]
MTLENRIVCPLTITKECNSKVLTQEAIGLIKDRQVKKLNAIWLEVTGCSGNIMSFLNSENPGLNYILTELVNLTYNNTLMTSEGDFAFEGFLNTLNTEFILLVDGAVSTSENGFYNIVDTLINREVIKLPGYPCHPDWVVGTFTINPITRISGFLETKVEVEENIYEG